MMRLTYAININLYTSLPKYFLNKFSTKILLSYLLLFFAQPAFADITLQQKQIHILNRLGYGPNQQSLARIQAIGIEKYIDEQLNSKNLELPPNIQSQLDLYNAPSIENATANVMSFSHAIKAARASQNEQQEKMVQAQRNQIYQQVFQAAQNRKFLLAVYNPNQLQEVMVDFWYNHFNVYANKSAMTKVLFADYETNAIRPYVLGKFGDLLNATAHHPAMLDYLDNKFSSKPITVKNKLTGGINENYARELMELHTLGVNGGYSQADVTALAKILSGWTYTQQDIVDGKYFTYKPDLHDTSAKQWLNINFVAGQQQIEGEKALQILANSPVTAQHICFELASYFVADTPPPQLVHQLTQKFLQTKGDIRQVLNILFHSPEFFNPQYVNQKFKPPFRYLVSSMRISDIDKIDPDALEKVSLKMGMPLYGAITPDGYDWKESAWLTPNAIKNRIDYAVSLGQGNLFNRSKNLAQNSSYTLNPDLMFSHLAPTLSEPIKKRYEQLTNSVLKSTLLIGSPDFMHY